MIFITPDITWPEEIPLPYLDYAGRPRYSTISSPIENGYIARRSRFSRPCLAVAVKWVLLPAQYDSFKIFFSDTLGNGTACFSLEVRYPKNSELTEWTARFRGGYQAQPMEGVWSITGELEIINKLALGALAPRAGATINGDLFDDEAGLVLEGLSAPGYPALEFMDVDLGDVLEETATGAQLTESDSVDSYLGSIL